MGVVRLPVLLLGYSSLTFSVWLRYRIIRTRAMTRSVATEPNQSWMTGITY